jgi:hypothetical protein
VTCQDMFVAGADTTNNTLGFCLLYMVLHPHVQSAAQQELDSVLGRDRRPSIEDKHRLVSTRAASEDLHRRVVSVRPHFPYTYWTGIHATVRSHVSSKKVIIDRLKSRSVVFQNFWSLSPRYNFSSNLYPHNCV